MDTERELLKGNTPTLVLAVLRDGPLHGYAIARAIERRSGDVLRCKEGTLYPTLQALERDGLVTAEWHREQGLRDRKVYTLTPRGLSALEQREEVWNRFAAAIHSVLAGETDEEAKGKPGRTRGRRRGSALPEPGSA